MKIKKVQKILVLNKEKDVMNNFLLMLLLILSGIIYSKDNFNIYTKTITDRNGNEFHVFFKEDTINNWRKDSTVYNDGSWEVFEMKGNTETSLRNSLGASSLSIRDSKGKLQERKLIGKNGNLIIHNKYVWKNDLLVKVISLEGIRNYYYGKNPYEDTVIVVPSDKGYDFNGGYDGSVGKIPKKGDKYYKNYLADPYGIWSIEEDTFEIEKKNEEPCLE